MPESTEPRPHRLRRASLKLTLISTIYVPLSKFEHRGYVRAFHGPPTPERGGRSKRFFRLTPFGLEALNYARQVNEEAWSMLPKLALDGESFA